MYTPTVSSFRVLPIHYTGSGVSDTYPYERTLGPNNPRSRVQFLLKKVHSRPVSTKRLLFLLSRCEVFSSSLSG